MLIKDSARESRRYRRSGRLLAGLQPPVNGGKRSGAVSLEGESEASPSGRDRREGGRGEGGKENALLPVAAITQIQTLSPSWGGDKMHLYLAEGGNTSVTPSSLATSRTPS